MGVPYQIQLPWVTYDFDGNAVLPEVEAPTPPFAVLPVIGPTQNAAAWLVIAVGVTFLLMRWT